MKFDIIFLKKHFVSKPLIWFVIIKNSISSIFFKIISTKYLIVSQVLFT